MDAATAVVSLLVAGVTALPNVPAFTADGRERLNLRRDCELLALLPEGDGRDTLAQHVDTGVNNMIASRARNRTTQRTIALASALLTAGWVGIVVTMTVPTEPTSWAPLALTVVLAASVLLVLVGLSGMAGLLLKTFWEWLRRRDDRPRARRSTPPTAT